MGSDVLSPFRSTKGLAPSASCCARVAIKVVYSYLVKYGRVILICFPISNTSFRKTGLTSGCSSILTSCVELLLSVLRRTAPSTRPTRRTAPSTRPTAPSTRPTAPSILANT